MKQLETAPYPTMTLWERRCPQNIMSSCAFQRTHMMAKNDISKRLYTSGGLQGPVCLAKNEVKIEWNWLKILNPFGMWTVQIEWNLKWSKNLIARVFNRSEFHLMNLKWKKRKMWNGGEEEEKEKMRKTAQPTSSLPCIFLEVSLSSSSSPPVVDGWGTVVSFRNSSLHRFITCFKRNKKEISDEKQNDEERFWSSN